MRTSNGISAFAADGAHLALLQRAQQLRLQPERQLADLVEEERAAVRLRRRGPCAAVFASVNAPRDVAEQLALEQRLGHRRAVDGDERARRLRRLRWWMRARDELLAGAALAGDEHRRVGLGDARRPGRSTLPHRAGSSPTSSSSASDSASDRGAGASPPRGARGAATARSSASASSSMSNGFVMKS